MDRFELGQESPQSFRLLARRENYAEHGKDLMTN